MTPIRPDQISVEELHDAVGRAVELAEKRRKLVAEPGVFGSDFYRMPWWIIGRRLRQEFDLGDAFNVAEEITASVEETAGIKLAPAVTRVDKDILIGFIERFRGGMPGGFGGPGIG